MCTALVDAIFLKVSTVKRRARYWLIDMIKYTHAYRKVLSGEAFRLTVDHILELNA